MRLVPVLLLPGLLLAADAQARMYQWVSSDSGRVQLAGNPPAWYRGVHPGPRVLVFENGELVDDTAVAVSEAQRAELRADAFGTAAEDTRQTSARTALESELEQIEPQAQAPVAAVPAEQPPAVSDADKAAALKALIDAWDRRQLDQARALLELLPEAEPAPAP